MKIPGRVPGMNVLATALSVITPQFVKYYKNSGRITNEIGMLISEYESPIVIRGSWQLVSRKVKEQMGLDFNADYVIFYCPSTYIEDVERDRSGDKLEYEGSHFKCIEAPSDWFSTDGWVGIWAVRVPNDD